MILLEIELFVIAKDLSEVLVDIVHDKEDTVRVLGLVFFWNNNIKKLDCEDIVFHLSQSSQDCDFSENSFARVDVVKSILDVFDCYSFAGRFLGSFHYLAEAALSLNFDELVVGGDVVPDSWKVID